jgi:hypothetical protein
LQQVLPVGQQLLPQQTGLPGGQQLSPQQVSPTGQQLLPQHFDSDGSQQLAPQQVWSAAQQFPSQQWSVVSSQRLLVPQQTSPGPMQNSPQQATVPGSQQVVSQPKTAGLPKISLIQQTFSAQPRAGGLHVVPLHVVTGLAQTALKQMVEQQSLSWVQACPVAKQLALAHCPVWLQLWPLGQVPQLPPQPSGPHALP